MTARGGNSRARSITRRKFLKTTGAGVAGASLLGTGACAGFTPSVEASKGAVIFTHGPDDTGNKAKVVDRFNKEQNGRIVVVFREMPADTGQYFDKMRTEFQAGGGTVDVIGGDVIWPAQLAANGWIMELSDLFTEEMQSNYLSGPLDSGKYQDGIYGVPWYADAGMLWYRKDLMQKSGFDKPPETWDELMSIAAKVQKDSGLLYGYVGQGSEYEGGVCNGCEFVWNAGGEFLDPDDPTKVILDSEESRAGLGSEAELVAEGIAPLAMATYKETESLTAFMNQDAVFLRNWPYTYASLADPAAGSTFNPKTVYDQVGVAPIPVNEKGTKSYRTLGGWSFLINNFSTKKEQAWEFIQYMTSPEVREFFAIEESTLPPEKQYYEDKQLIKKQPLLEVAGEAIASTKPRPVHRFYSDMSLKMAEEFNENLKGEVATEDAIVTLQDQLSRIASTETG
jgi:multiple sugar transport system substrate-binding protein